MLRRATRGLPLVPSVGLLLVFLAGPILYCVYAAFTDMALTGSGATGNEFVGFDNFTKAFTEPAFANAVFLTLLFTLFSAVLGQNILGMLTILFSTGLPITAVMVPVYGLFVQLDLIDSMAGTTLFMATTGLPFAIWLMKNFMDGVPVDLEEAAWVDGASGMRALWHVVLPLMWPGVAVVAIFTFIKLWGEFFIPFMLLLSPDLQPASVTIFTLFGQYGGVNYGQLAAFSVMYSLPVIALYILLSRKLGGAFAFGGALKG